MPASVPVFLPIIHRACMNLSATAAISCSPRSGLVSDITDRLNLPNADWLLANTERVWLHRASNPGTPGPRTLLNEPGDPDRMRQLLAQRGQFGTAPGAAKQGEAAAGGA